ncbi:MAG: Nif3-like dinuclear metal center hexameric protein [Candidatus Heimdallarchaeota archaeon]|nr:MAG: hypothetical protein DRO63_08235 [Candidatus Gerdarchaeota archaeon]RLI72697.1 MAG: hypothetical protein DRP02_00895 [Candidatus Gerdarchaeota archaeon]RLI74549.1 MAG: hypothetical protein DRO91_00150 [Candidatus Heimdallarchaeota archaeon]
MTRLEEFFKQYAEKEGSSFLLGKDWLTKGKQEPRDCLITARLTSGAVAKALQEEVQTIICIYPPFFTQGSQSGLVPWELEILTMLIDNRLAVFSLGENWITKEQGGFDYLLELLDFRYKQPLFNTYNKQWLTANEEPQKVLGRLGEHAKKLDLDELLTLITQLTNENHRYFGYNKHPIKQLAILERVMERTTLSAIITNNHIDGMVVGRMFYEGLLVVQQLRFPTIVLGERVLENLLLRQVQRQLLEVLELEVGRIVIYKQKKLGTLFLPKD